MSVATLSRLPRAGALRLSQVHTAHLLAGIVAFGFLGRLLGAWTRATPTFFPDEYLYAELGRSIADGSLPLVRGASSGFPSLLHPLVTAPFWLIDDVETAFRAIQAFDAALMSLAALAAFAIARQLGLGRNLALVVAGAALLGPDLLLSGWLVAEPLAYPLVLASVWATARAVERPTPGAQLALLGLLGLTTLARLQLVVVALVALAAIVLIGVRERRLARALREQWIVLGATAVFLAIGAGLLATRRLGVYSGILDLEVDPLGVASWAAPTALLVVYSAGWIIVPGALIGLCSGLIRPRSRAEATVALFTTLLAIALLAEAGFISNSITGDLHERYVFYLVPLAITWFAVWMHRGATGRIWHTAAALGLGTVAVWVPVTRFSAGRGKTDAPFLRAVGGLEDALANPGTAAAVVAGVCVIGSIMAVLAHRRAGLGGPRAILAGALVFAVASSAFATGFDRDNSLRVQQGFVGKGGSWIDRLGVEDATLLWGDNGRPAAAHEALFWNRSVSSVALLPESNRFDDYAAASAEISSDGSLRKGGEPLTGWVVVDEYAASPTFAEGTALGGTDDLALYRFDAAPARLSSLFDGRFFDGLLSGRGALTVWPEAGETGVSGTVRLTVRAPADGPDRMLTFAGAGDPLTITAGTEETIELVACTASGPWRIEYEASPPTSEGARTVTLASTPLEYVGSAGACG